MSDVSFQISIKLCILKVFTEVKKQKNTHSKSVRTQLLQSGFDIMIIQVKKQNIVTPREA